MRRSVQGIPELLAQLEHDVCVASNSSLAYVKRALFTTGIAPYFGEKVYSARDINRPKPAPDLFFHAARESGFAPQDCLVIEDSVSGIQAAQNAGMRVVGFLGGRHCNQVVTDRLLNAQASHYCRTAEELRNLIAELFV